MVYIILVAYIAIVFLGSLRGAKRETSTAEGYFLANRDLKTLVLLFTILATNFSAFYFLGFAGEGYRVGYPYYVVMALGTGFAALSFFLIGSRAWKLGKAKGYITPAELVYGQTGSRPLSYVVAVVMVLFTFPYLALQIVGAGYILEQLTAGNVPYLLGASLLTVFTIVYVWIGGMSSVAKTDLKQGLLAIGFMFIAVVVIAKSVGGLSAGNLTVFERLPELFSRTGTDGTYSPQKWFSLMAFWFFCIPMFPQIFMRFYLAKDVRHLKNSAMLYGAIPLVIGIFPVIIGVLGHITFPNLSGREADQILPMMLVAHTPKWFGALVMTGALAAFMSTLDSQLLALSTIITRDFYLPLSTNKPGIKRQVRMGRLWVVILAVIGLLIAARPFDTIFDMGRLAFAGLSLLFPAVFLAVRTSKVPSTLAITGILVGEVLLLLFYYQVLPAKWLMGFDAAIPLLALGFLIVGLGMASGRK